MGVEFLSDRQAAAFGRFSGVPTQEQLERYFLLDDADRALVGRRRGDQNRLGFSVQLTTGRFLGTFLADPLEVPWVVVEFVAAQLGIADPSRVKGYGSRLPTKHEHAREIRDAVGYRDFSEAEVELRAWLEARLWATPERPGVMFDRATAWLVERRVLLPGASVLARLVTSAREATVVDGWTEFTSAFTHVSSGESRMGDLGLSAIAVLVAEACNVGLVPVLDAGVAALTRQRLAHVDQNYVRSETITAANAMLVEAQTGIDLAQTWGGGQLASADGLRFIVPVRTINAGPNPRYFGTGRRHLAQLPVRPGRRLRRGARPRHGAGLAAHPGRPPRQRDRRPPRTAHHRHSQLQRPGLRPVPPPRLPVLTPPGDLADQRSGASTGPPTTGRSTPSPATGSAPA